MQPKKPVNFVIPSLTVKPSLSKLGHPRPGNKYSMINALPIYIGYKYVGAKRRNHFISFISLMSVMGLTLGVAVLIIVMSVMNGFERELRQRVLGMVPHAAIYARQGAMSDWASIAEDALTDPGVDAAAPFIRIQGMLTQAGRVKGALITGVEPSLEAEVSNVEDPGHIIQGRWDDLKPGHWGIVLGSILAHQLGVSVGDKLILVMPEASISAAGVIPRLRRFEVVAIFELGAEVDQSLGYIHIEDAAKLKRLLPGEVEGVRLHTSNLFDAQKIAWRVVNRADTALYASDWTRTHGTLFAAIQMEKRLIGLLLMMIVAVAAFNIISTLIMVVTDKRSDIAILRTLGMSAPQITAVFMTQGTLIGCIGTVLGTLLGVIGSLSIADIIAWIERTFNITFLDPNVYFISQLPSDLRPMDVVLISSTAFLLTVLATLYPAWRASKIHPVEVLRYE
jgi:lipoprotein-releasing system permease protein